MTDIKDMTPAELVILIEKATMELATKQYAKGYKDGNEDCKKAMEEKENIKDFILQNTTSGKENE